MMGEKNVDICEELPGSLSIRQCETGGAVFDRNKKYRYLLWRSLGENGRANSSRSMLLVMLNPNTADELRNDPTIRRCIGFANAWGYNRIEVVNLFAYRAREPVMLKSAVKPIGIHNDQIIRQRAKDAALRIVAWGNHGRLFERDHQVMELLAEFGPVFCLGKTKSGSPKHPLYLRSDAEPLKFSLSDISRI